MSDIASFLKSRRSALAMTMEGDPPSDAEIAEMIEIASRVPDHGKLTPWRFISYSKETRQLIANELEKRISGISAELHSTKWQKELERFAAVPLAIAVVSTAAEHPKIPQWEQVLSAGAACMNLVMAANALGYEAQWLTGWYTYDRDALKLIGVKEGENVAGMIHIGKSSTEKQERPRPAVTDIHTRWTL